MPEMTGIEMLAEVRRLSPETKLLLLTAYADTDVAVKAINDINLDYYMFKPWDPPEERLYPVVDGLLDDWSTSHPPETSEVRVLGHRWSDRSFEVKAFLARNHVPYRWPDVEGDGGGAPRPGPRGWREGGRGEGAPPAARPRASAGCGPPPGAGSRRRGAGGSVDPG